jgi:hypothetical protein
MVYIKGMFMRGRLMEVRAREEVRCMLKRLGHEKSDGL